MEGRNEEKEEIGGEGEDIESSVIGTPYALPRNLSFLHPLPYSTTRSFFMYRAQRFYPDGSPSIFDRIKGGLMGSLSRETSFLFFFFFPSKNLNYPALEIR